MAAFIGASDHRKSPRRDIRWRWPRQSSRSWAAPAELSRSRWAGPLWPVGGILDRQAQCVCVGCLLSLLGPGRGRLGWQSERFLRRHGLRLAPSGSVAGTPVLFFSRCLSLSLTGFGRGAAPGGPEGCACPALPHSLFGVLMAMPGVLRWWVALACSPAAPRSCSLGTVVPVSCFRLRPRGSTSCP